MKSKGGVANRIIFGAYLFCFHFLGSIGILKRCLSCMLKQVTDRIAICRLGEENGFFLAKIVLASPIILNNLELSGLRNKKSAESH